jgi:hypothetical protein
LELDDVPFRVGDVAPRDVAAVGRLERHDVADEAASLSQHSRARRSHVRDDEGDVAETGPIDDGRQRVGLRRVLVDLERWAGRAVAGQAQVGSAQRGARDPRPRLEIGTGIIALRRDEDAAEQPLVKSTSRRQSRATTLTWPNRASITLQDPPVVGRAPMRRGPCRDAFER